MLTRILTRGSQALQGFGVTDPTIPTQWVRFYARAGAFWERTAGRYAVTISTMEALLRQTGRRNVRKLHLVFIYFDAFVISDIQTIIPMGMNEVNPMKLNQTAPGPTA